MSQSPVELALAAWGRPRDPDDAKAQPQIDDALALAATGVFSVRHIMLITDLPSTFAYRLLQRHSRSGGRFTPEALPQLYDLYAQWSEAHACDRALLRLVVDLGVSPRMISRLTAIPLNNIYRWTKETS